MLAIIFCSFFLVPKGVSADTTTSTLSGAAQSIAITSYTGTNSTLSSLTFTSYGIYGAGGAASTTAIRIKIPAVVNAVFDRTVTTSTQGLTYALNGQSGTGSLGATSTVYLDNKTVQINPVRDLSSGDVLAISGLKAYGINYESSAVALQFSVDGGSTYHDGTFTLAVIPATLTSTGIAPNPNPVATVSVGANPYGSAYDGSYLWVTNVGAVTVSKIDVNSNAVVATVAAGSGPSGIAYDGTYVWVANSNSGDVSKIDAVTNQVVATTTVGTYPLGTVYHDGYVWVLNYSSNSVSKIDAVTNQVVATITVAGPWDGAFDGSYLWVTNYGSKSVSKIDPNSDSVVATAGVGTYPDGIVWDGSHIWVGNYGSNNVSKVDVDTNRVIATTTVGAGPAGLAFDGTHLWVSNWDGNTVSKVDPNTNAVVATVAVKTRPYYPSTDGVHVWVPNYGSNNVSKLNVALRSLATSTVAAAFTTTTSTPSDGKLKVTFPSGFDVSGVTSSTCISGGFTGSFATSVSGQSVIITRSGGSVAAPGAKSCLIDNVVSPDNGTTGTFTVETQTSSGDSQTIETDGSVPAVSVVPGVSPAVFSPASYYTGSLTETRINFTVSVPIPADGSIRFVFPTGFSTGYVVSATCPSMDGSFVISEPSSSELVLTRSGGTQEPGGAQSCVVTSVRNSDTSGTSGAFTIQTLSSLNRILDSNTGIVGISLVSGRASVDMIPPGDAYGVTTVVASDGTGVSLRWSNPSDPDLAGVRLYRSMTSGVLDRLLTTTLSGTYADTGLTPGITYYYYLRPVDTNGNEARGQEYAVTVAVSDAPVTTIPVPVITPEIAPGTATSSYSYPIGVGAYDLVKSSSMDAVYFVAHGKRYPFPSEMVFRSWYPDFGEVKTITDSALASFAIGGTVLVRPGTYLVKITSDPKVYAVEPGGVLRWVETETVAETLYGVAWAARVRDLDVSAFQGYAIGDGIAVVTYPSGSVVSDGGTTYYVEPAGKREFTGGSLSSNRIRSEFVLTSAATLPAAGAEITGVEPAIAQPVVEY